MTDDKTIGEFIRALREEKQMSQQKIADLVNIDRTVFNKWENGKVTIPAPHLRTIAKILDVSTDEILVGEKMTADNREKFANIHLELFEKNKRIKKSVKILISIVIGIIIMFLGYYFISNYNSIHVYKITSESDLFTINNGLFIKARDKVYFELNNTYLIEEEKIDKVKVCYEYDAINDCILETTDFSKISFIDYYGYEEYIPFKDIDNIMKNMSVEIALKDGQVKSSKLIFTKDYANTNYFLNNRKEIGDNRYFNHNNEIAKIDEINKRFIEYVNLSNLEVIEHNIEEKDYNISYNGRSILIEYFKDNQKVIISCSIGSKKILQVDFYENLEFVKNECLYSLSDQKCLDGNCDNYSEYLDIYIEVISSFLNNIDN